MFGKTKKETKKQPKKKFSAKLSRLLFDRSQSDRSRCLQSKNISFAICSKSVDDNIMEVNEFRKKAVTRYE